MQIKKFLYKIKIMLLNIKIITHFSLKNKTILNLNITNDNLKN